MDMGKIVKRSVEKQGMLAWQFNTIGVSDGITMGSEGRSAHSHGLAKTLSLTNLSQHQECATPSSRGRS